MNASELKPASGQPAPPQAHGGQRAPLHARAGSMLSRVLLGCAGAGLLIGFFMPWLVLGQIAALSGFSLMVTQGQVVDMLSGSHRIMLFGVPLIGVALVAGALLGPRWAVWTGTITGATLLAFGLFTLISLFFATTGLGLWIVVGSALLAFVVGLIGVVMRRRPRPRA